jgi:tight adherence protein B
MTPFAAVAVALALLATAGAAWALLGGRGRDRRLTARIASMSRPYAPLRSPELAMRRVRPRNAPLVPEAMLRRVAALFGFARERLDQYPASPTVIVLGLTAPALLAAFYAQKLLGPLGWAAAPVAWLVLSRGVFGHLHRRRAEALYLQLPDALAMVVRAVRAGVPVVEALRGVSRESMEPTAGEFRRMTDQVGIGIPLEQALRALADRSGLPEYAFFAVALTLQNTAGGNLTETLENLADVIRKRVAMRQRGHALASQARASAYILSGVPVVAGLALAVINPRYILLLFDDPRGNMLLGGAIGMLLTGITVMKGIIRKSLT